VEVGIGVTNITVLIILIKYIIPLDRISVILYISIISQDTRQTAKVLDRRTVQRLGSKAEIEVDVKVISTTNRSLEDLGAKKEFGEDLRYRPNVVSIYTSPAGEKRRYPGANCMASTRQKHRFLGSLLPRLRRNGNSPERVLSL